MEENKEFQNMEETPIPFNQEEFLKKVEDAAREGASKAKGKGNWLDSLKLIQPVLTLIILLSIVFGAMGIASNWNNFTEKLADITKLDSLSNHDMELENHGLFGFTAADFAEALLGDAEQLKKLEVYSREVSDVATITNAGFLGWEILSKSQMITYHGTVVYTVDLTGLGVDNLVVDKENNKIILTVPKVVREDININEENIEFADPEKGLLAFGDVTMTPENVMKVQAEARTKMEQKLEEENVIAEAERFAKMSVWEIYQPILSSVAPGYLLEIHFQ